MAKKHDLPAMPFYFGDWMKAPEIRALPLDTRMVWFEMLGFMWESTERGYLTINGHPIPMSSLAQMIGVTEVLLEQKFKQLSDFAVFSIRESDGAIYSRRMVRDEDIRNIRQKAGSEGGKKSFASRFAQAKSQANSESESEYANENESKDLKLYSGESFFYEVWRLYPRKEGKKESFRHYKASVKTEEDYNNIHKALTNYKTALQNKKTEPQFIQQGSRWFNNWNDWISPDETIMKGNSNGQTSRSAAVAQPGKYDRFSKNEHPEVIPKQEVK